VRRLQIGDVDVKRLRVGELQVSERPSAPHDARAEP
jgi:hypothetical protein